MPHWIAIGLALCRYAQHIHGFVRAPLALGELWINHSADAEAASHEIQPPEKCPPSHD